MGEIRVGTASWTDRTLLDSGWYPQTADNPEKRLSHYAKTFPLVEVDATYLAVGGAEPGELMLTLNQGLVLSYRIRRLLDLATATPPAAPTPALARATVAAAPDRRLRPRGVDSGSSSS